MPSNSDKSAERTGSSQRYPARHILTVSLVRQSELAERTFPPHRAAEGHQFIGTKRPDLAIQDHGLALETPHMAMMLLEGVIRRQACAVGDAVPVSGISESEADHRPSRRREIIRH
jgi:hypothetical protein